MRIRRLVSGGLFAVLVACNSESGSTSANVSGGSRAAAGSSVSAPGDGTTTDAGAAPLDPKIAASRCEEPCLFLVETPFDKLIETYKAACGKDTKDLGYEDCEQIDYARNCIYAAHGLVFKAKKWQLFATKPWYVAHAEFKASTISALERANVHELNTRGKACKNGLRISPHDLALVKAWFGKLARHHPELPKARFANGKAATAEEFVSTCQDELGQRGDRKLVFNDDMALSYDDELPGVLVTAAAVPPGTKLRSIRLHDGATFNDGSQDITEGVELGFLYDEHDRLWAVEVTHFLWD